MTFDILKLNVKWCCTTLYASPANFESTLTPNAESAPTPTPTLTTTQSAPTPCVVSDFYI